LLKLKIAVVGYGSIGQASINLLLNKLGTPASIIIADLTNQITVLKQPIAELKKIFKGNVHVVPVENSIVSEEIYLADLIIGSSSCGNIIDVEKLASGSILVDDSFPSIVNTCAAVDRMKKKKDILIIGAGKLHIGRRQREFIDAAISPSLVSRITLQIGDDGLPGCRIESLLMSFDHSLPTTTGIVTNETALAYWNWIELNELQAVNFHLEGFRVDEILISNMKTIIERKNCDHGQIER
jgi:predicted amino acid dehydrogenase